MPSTGPASCHDDDFGTVLMTRSYKFFKGDGVLSVDLSVSRTASLASWLRRPPQEWQTRVRFPLSPWGFFGIELYQWLRNWYSACLAFTWSVLGLVDPVSVYCDWVR